MGKHASLTNVSQIFNYTQSLLKRASGGGDGSDILLLFQDIYGKWKKYEWTNRMKLISNYLSCEQNKNVQQIQTNKGIKNEMNESLFDELKICIADCQKHSSLLSKMVAYNIVIIANQHCLSLNAKNEKIKCIKSLSAAIPINVSMLCLCSNPKTKQFKSYDLINNVCSVCNYQFAQKKSVKKQAHFATVCHQIALKQIAMSKPPPFKKQKLNQNENEMNESVLFWQKLISFTSGIFRWIFLSDFGQSDIELVLDSMTNKIASHTKLRWLAMGCLMAKIQIFPSPNNEYFQSPNNANHKISTFESMNEQQLKFEIAQNQKKNAFVDAVHQNLSGPHCELTILHQNNLNIAIGGDILSILGFLDRTSEWISIPTLSRHFILPLDATSNICHFVKDLMKKTNRIGVVSLNPPNKSNWYGFIYLDKDCLILDILSPYINVSKLLFAQNNVEKERDILGAYDCVASHFPTNSNVSKEFDKFIRCIKQKKIIECFQIAQNIKSKAVNFHIPNLLKHLLSVIQKEKEMISFDLPLENEAKHQLDILNKLIFESQTDKRLKIQYFANKNNNNNKHHHHHHKYKKKK